MNLSIKTSLAASANASSALERILPTAIVSEVCFFSEDFPLPTDIYSG